MSHKTSPSEHKISHKSQEFVCSNLCSWFFVLVTFFFRSLVRSTLWSIKCPNQIISVYKIKIQHLFTYTTRINTYPFHLPSVSSILCIFSFLSRSNLPAMFSWQECLIKDSSYLLSSAYKYKYLFTLTAKKKIQNCWHHIIVMPVTLCLQVVFKE